MGDSKSEKNNRSSSGRKPGMGETGVVPFAEQRFANIELTPDEKEEFRELLSDGRLGAVPFDDWLEENYSVRISRPRDGRGVVVTLVCSSRSHLNGGLMLTAFAGDTATALAVLRYKDEIICGADGWRQAMHERAGGDVGIG